jgi:sensor domain CHASE-containing protein
MNNPRAIKHSKIWPIVIFVSLLVCTFFVDHLLTRQAILKDREIVKTKVSAMAVGLSTAMNQLLQVTYSLSAYVKIKVVVSEDEFMRFANAAIGDAKGIKSLQLAPNAIVTFLTNKKENAGAIGYNLLGDPKRRPLVEAAIKERRYVIAGPIDLVQGGRAVIARNPIFLKNSGGSDYFWGFATILLDVDTILKNTISIQQQNNLNISIRGKDALGPKGDTFYGDPSVFEGDPILEEIKLPSGSWQIGVNHPGDIPGLQRMKNFIWGIGFIFALISARLIRNILVEPEVLGKEKNS